MEWVLTAIAIMRFDRAESPRFTLRILEGFGIKVRDGIVSTEEKYYRSFSGGTVQLDLCNSQEEKRLRSFVY